jgi:hypothetical protein
MSKRQRPQEENVFNVSEMREMVTEFTKRLSTIEAELELLKEDRKNLLEEFKPKLDMKTLTAAMRTIKIRKKVDAKDTFELFVELLEEHENV